MSARTCVWLPSGGDVGHSSIYVRSEYLSFWPSVTYKAPPARIPLTDWVPSRFHTYTDDYNDEDHKNKHLVVILNHLDEDRMLDYIRRIKSKKPQYHMKYFNCTTVVK